MRVNVNFILIGLVISVFITQSFGHSYVTSPISRSNQKQSNTGCRGPLCFGPCDRPVSGITRAPIQVQRGQSISVEWPRNNHAGGFIRLAWAPTSESDSFAAFDNGVQQINCHEVGGCGPDDASNPNGGDSGPGDGSSRACKVSINVPSSLPDGRYTLQWVWFGGAFFLGDYYSCIDYVISGGEAISPKEAPAFIGGDYSYPNQQKCKYFNTDRVGRCKNEPCDNPVYAAGERSGMPYMAASSVTPTPAVVTTGRSTPVTTGKPAAVTTGRVPSTPSTPVTTGRVPSTPATPVTTGRATPVTTGRVPSTPSTPSTTTGKAVVPSTQENNVPCTLGHQKCNSENSYQACGWVSRTETGWTPQQRCPTGLTCHSFQDNYVLCY